jgi:hypothetical protein
MDDLAQISPWRSRPKRDEPQLPLRSPLVFDAAPAVEPEPRPEPIVHLHRFGRGFRADTRVS